LRGERKKPTCEKAKGPPATKSQPTLIEARGKKKLSPEAGVGAGKRCTVRWKATKKETVPRFEKDRKKRGWGKRCLGGPGKSAKRKASGGVETER